MIKYFFIFCVAFSFLHLEGLDLKEQNTPMTISVIVPCHHKHFRLIPDLLAEYEKQTVLPDEVVISLTVDKLDKIDAATLEMVKNSAWPFKVSIVSNEGEFPGRARNRACECSFGLLLICQDADDIPHPRRTEILKFMFENYKVDFVIHRWIFEQQPFPEYSVEDSLALSAYVDEYDSISFDFIHNGNVALTREVFNATKWPYYNIGEDSNFNKDVFRNFKYKVELNEFLIIYRNMLSSYIDRYID